MIIKKITVLVSAVCVLALSLSYSISAQADVCELLIPTYGLYCEDSDAIKSGNVNFDLSDSELLIKGTGLKQSEYNIEPTNRETEFIIPFISSVTNMPVMRVNINGEQVEGAVWYGEDAFRSGDSFDVEKLCSSELDENIIGTLYTVIPDSDTITISATFNESESLIYEASEKYSYYHTTDGTNIWTIHNSLSKSRYNFFFLGEETCYSFESSCGYSKKNLSCKQFVDGYYEIFKDFYDKNGGVCAEFFYAQINALLQFGLVINNNQLFFDSITEIRLNAYKFRAVIEQDCVISYDMPVRVQRNFSLSPIVYSVANKQVGNYPISYTTRLNSEFPYITKSSIETERDGVSYTAKTAEDFYFTISSSENPKLNSEKKDGKGLIIGIVCACVGAAAILIIVVECIKHKNSRNVYI